MKITGQMKKITMSDGQALDAWHVEAVGERKGGVVLVQEIFGLTDHIREQCQIYADAGYEVLAPALFDRVAPGLRLSYSKADIDKAIDLVRAHSLDLAVADARTCIDILAAKGKVGVVGYCYGGSVSYAVACRVDNVVAASCYYGGMIPKLKTETPRCPTIVHLGDADQEIPVDEVKSALDEMEGVTTLVYDAGHGFNSDRRADYDEKSASLARQMTLALFASV